MIPKPSIDLEKSCENKKKKLTKLSQKNIRTQIINFLSFQNKTSEHEVNTTLQRYYNDIGQTF